MYTGCMSEKMKFPPRLSLPLSEKEREEIIDLKSTLQKERRTLKGFVLEAIMEKWKREKFEREGVLPPSAPPKKK